MDVSSENKLKYETVVFDLDGVIIDSSWDIADAVNGILEIYDCKTRDYNFIKKKYRRWCEEHLITMLRRG